MPTIAQGGTITLDAIFANGAGTLVDPVTPQVDIINPSGSTLVTDAVPTRSALGMYSYAYAVAAAAPLGIWTAHWTGIINSVAVAADDYFTVVVAVPPGNIQFPSTLDVLSLAEAKMALNIDAANTDQDVEIGSYISAVTAGMDAKFGPIVQRSVMETHDGGSNSVFLKLRPVASATTVAERSGAVQTTLTPEDYLFPVATSYLLDGPTGILYRRSGGGDSTFAPGRANIVVTYVAGRYTTTALVGARFKQGAAITLSHLWRGEQGLSGPSDGPFGGGSVMPPWAFPRAVLQLLADQLVAPAIA